MLMLEQGTQLVRDLLLDRANKISPAMAEEELETTNLSVVAVFPMGSKDVFFSLLPPLERAISFLALLPLPPLQLANHKCWWSHHQEDDDDDAPEEGQLFA